MIKRLKLHLTFIYTITSGLILSVVLISVFWLNHMQLIQHTKEKFLTEMDTLSYKLQFSNSINIPWMSQEELNHDLIIYIEDNGKSLSLNESYPSKTSRSKLIDMVHSEALEDGVILSTYPSAATTSRTSIFTITGDYNENYYASVAIIPLANGWRSLTLIQSYSFGLQNIRTIIFYILAELIGVLLLFVIGKLFVERAVFPIEENNRKQSEFIAAASHEFRSPLTIIKAELSALKYDYENITDIQTLINSGNQYLNEMNRECNRMSRLINDMLLLASSNCGTWSIREEVLDVDTFLIESYDSLSTLCNFQNRELNLDLPTKNLGQMKADKERILQIFNIILNNALSYTPADTPLTLSANIKKSNVEICFIDHGPGIPDKDKQYIFDTYYRGDKSRNSKNHFGLGLSIAKELTLLHLGKLSVADTIGGGTTFVITLPLLIRKDFI